MSVGPGLRCGLMQRKDSPPRGGGGGGPPSGMCCRPHAAAGLWWWGRGGGGRLAKPSGSRGRVHDPLRAAEHEGHAASRSSHTHSHRPPSSDFEVLCL